MDFLPRKGDWPETAPGYQKLSGKGQTPDSPSSSQAKNLAYSIRRSLFAESGCQGRQAKGPVPAKGFMHRADLADRHAQCINLESGERQGALRCACHLPTDGDAPAVMVGSGNDIVDQPQQTGVKWVHGGRPERVITIDAQGGGGQVVR